MTATVVYDFPQPGLPEARTALGNLYGDESGARWDALLATAGLTGTETDPASFDRLVAAMLAADPVTALCGRAMAIRAATFTHLAKVYEVVLAAA